MLVYLDIKVCYAFLMKTSKMGKRWLTYQGKMVSFEKEISELMDKNGRRIAGIRYISIALFSSFCLIKN